ncbi:MAG TPA: homoserine dehydrogenase, partial [Actinoplanes sp.]|nr:homoserine dehydrogenase [Actinoplanes sp.]
MSSGSAKPAVRLALLGCGTVGSEVVRLLHEQADDLTARIGAPLDIVGIAVRRLGRAR